MVVHAAVIRPVVAAAVATVVPRILRPVHVVRLHRIVDESVMVELQSDHAQQIGAIGIAVDVVASDRDLFGGDPI